MIIDGFNDIRLGEGHMMLLTKISQDESMSNGSSISKKQFYRI